VHALARDWDAAVGCFSRAVRVDEGRADGWHNLGTALKRLGRRERAFEALKRALKLDPARAGT
jgi:tetratricopeptide (TPR) repeat protein